MLCWCLYGSVLFRFWKDFDPSRLRETSTSADNQSY